MIAMKWFGIVALVWALKLCLTLCAYWALRAATARWRKAELRTRPGLDSPANGSDIFQRQNRLQPWYVRVHGKIASLKGAHFKWQD